MYFTSTHRGYECKSCNASRAYSLALNPTQHSQSPSMLRLSASLLLRQGDSKLSPPHRTGNIHPNAEFQLCRHRKGYPRVPAKCPPSMCTPANKNPRHQYPKHSSRLQGPTTVQSHGPALSDKLLLRDSTACTALTACYSYCLRNSFIIYFPIYFLMYKYEVFFTGM